MDGTFLSSTNYDQLNFGLLPFNVMSCRHKTGVADTTHAVEERRVAARDLFLQVQSELGTQTMNELAAAVKSMKDGSLEDLKDTFVELLQKQPELLERFLAFLPKRLREGVSTSDMHAL